MEEAATRDKVAPYVAVNFLSALVTASGGDLRHYNLSANHLNTKKKKNMKKSAEEKSLRPTSCSNRRVG